MDIEDTEKLAEIAKKIRELIIKQNMPKDLEEEIIDNYEVLSFGDNGLEKASSAAASILKSAREEAFVAVRSSATTEDLAEASFAGQQETFLNIKGKRELLEAVKRCFASLFTARATYYREKKGFQHNKAYLAVVVQKMINSDKSGVMFSKDPVNQTDNIVIEAVYGLGEGIVSGQIKPDHYVVSKDLDIKEVKLAEKKIAIVRTAEGENKTVGLTDERSGSRVLSDYQLKKLADFALKLEDHYKKPQDIEFAIEDENLYIVQTRPITTTTVKEEEELEGELLLEGLPASPGVGSGTVTLIKDLADLNKVKKGDILVTKMTNPDMVVSMQKAAAIVTDEGGITSHAAIVSREMGIPAVVGTDKATKILKEGQDITVDGSRGKVYNGKVEGLKAKKVEVLPIEQTETEIKVMVDLPSFASRSAESKAKAVGLMRIEGIIAESGKHPMYFVKNKNIKGYEDLVYEGIKGIAEYFDKVWIRTSDIRTDEYKNLEGAPKDVEGNPMLGDHGIRFGLGNPDILKAEIRAVKRVADEKGKKIGFMLPQVISVEEVRKTKELAKEEGIDVVLDPKVDFGVMIETPAAVQIIEDLCKESLDFISFGTNDLTQYTLAIDRNNEEVQDLYNELHPAILSQIEKVIKTCKKYGIQSSICGQAGSRKEMAEFLVKLGIDSISVNADAASGISNFVRELEEKGLRGSALGEGEAKEEGRTEPEETEEKQEEKKDGPEKNERGRYDIICDDCGRDAEVPFKPKPGLPVYCKECYVKNKNKQKSEIKDKEDKQFKESLEKTEQESKEREDKEEKSEIAEEFPEVEYGFDIFGGGVQPLQKLDKEDGLKPIKEEEIKEEDIEDVEAEDIMRDNEDEEEEKMREGLGEETKDDGVLDIF